MKPGIHKRELSKQIKERGLKVKFETNEFFRVIFFKSLDYLELAGKVGEKVGETLTENQKLILEYISKGQLPPPKIKDFEEGACD